jgi:hypothetical protein
MTALQAYQTASTLHRAAQYLSYRDLDAVRIIVRCEAEILDRISEAGLLRNFIRWQDKQTLKR